MFVCVVDCCCCVSVCVLCVLSHCSQHSMVSLLCCIVGCCLCVMCVCICSDVLPVIMVVSSDCVVLLDDVLCFIPVSWLCAAWLFYYCFHQCHTEHGVAI